MVLSPQLKAVAMEVQRLLPDALPHWQERLQEWAAAECGKGTLAAVDAEAPEEHEWARSLLPARLSLPYQYALLAALNDRLADDDPTALRLDPWPRLGEDAAKGMDVATIAAFGVLKERLSELSDNDAPRLREVLEAVRANLGVGQCSGSPEALLAKQSKGLRASGSGTKRTAAGEAEDKIIEYLLKHHEYDTGRCGNYEPLGVNELARNAEVAPGSVTNFFQRKFAVRSEKGEGRRRYNAACKRRDDLDAAMKMLAGDLIPSQLWQKLPDGFADDESLDDADQQGND